MPREPRRARDCMSKISLGNRSGNYYDDPLSGEHISTNAPPSNIISVITESDGNGGGKGFLLARAYFINTMEKALGIPVRNGRTAPSFNFYGCLSANPGNPTIREIAKKLGMELPALPV